MNYIERRDALFMRRELRNPGLAKVRTYKFGKKTALLWNHMILPSKDEMLTNLQNNINQL